MVSTIFCFTVNSTMLLNDLRIQEIILCWINCLVRTKVDDIHEVIAHDEHLFIITHQAYGLNKLFTKLIPAATILESASEMCNLVVTFRLYRISLIWRLLSEQ